MADTENRFGVSPSDAAPTRIGKPPPVPETIWAAFLGDDGEQLAHDFRPDRPAQRWRFVVVNGTDNPLPLTLSWDGLASVPRPVRLWATDMTTGETFSLRQRSRYTFTAQPKEKRQFVVSALIAQGETDGAHPFGATPQRARGDGASVSDSAHVSAGGNPHLDGDD
jgi:hypothetical protein